MERPRRLPKALRTLAWGTTVAIFLVNMVGFLDTDTNSGLGCGRDWPLCNGAFLPHQWNVERLVEYGHRGLVSVAVVLALTVGVLALWRYGVYPQIRVLVAAAWGLVAVQAVFGAMAVVYVNPSWVLAFHFGSALMALVAYFLLAVELDTIGSAPTGAVTVRSPAVKRLTLMAWWVIASSYAVVYYSAYVTSRGDGLACGSWPLCQGRLVPEGTPATMDEVHRLAALGLAGLIFTLWLSVRRSPSWPTLQRGANLALMWVVVQMLDGVYVVLSHGSISALLTHAACMMALFVSEAYVTWQLTLGYGRGKGAGQGAQTDPWSPTIGG